MFGLCIPGNLLMQFDFLLIMFLLETTQYQSYYHLVGNVSNVIGALIILSVQ